MSTESKIKMKYDELINSIESHLGFKPTAKAFAKILNLSSEKIFYTRAQRNSNFTDDEIKLIEKAYNINLFLENKENDSIKLDYYPEVFGSCGDGVFALSQTKQKIEVPKNIIKSFSSLKKYSVINAIGDSMSPSIQDKDRLIVEHYEGEQIKDDRIYVFCYKDEIFVKRLVKNIDEIIIKSDNKDPMYRPRFIEKEDMNNILIIGQIIGLIREVN